MHFNPYIFQLSCRPISRYPWKLKVKACEPTLSEFIATAKGGIARKCNKSPLLILFSSKDQLPFGSWDKWLLYTMRQELLSFSLPFHFCVPKPPLRW